MNEFATSLAATLKLPLDTSGQYGVVDAGMAAKALAHINKISPEVAPEKVNELSAHLQSPECHSAVYRSALLAPPVAANGDSTDAGSLRYMDVRSLKGNAWRVTPNVVEFDESIFAIRLNGLSVVMVNTVPDGDDHEVCKGLFTELLMNNGYTGILAFALVVGANEDGGTRVSVGLVNGVDMDWWEFDTHQPVGLALESLISSRSIGAALAMLAHRAAGREFNGELVTSETLVQEIVKDAEAVEIPPEDDFNEFDDDDLGFDDDGFGGDGGFGGDKDEFDDFDNIGEGLDEMYAAFEGDDAHTMDADKSGEFNGDDDLPDFDDLDPVDGADALDDFTDPVDLDAPDEFDDTAEDELFESEEADKVADDISFADRNETKESAVVTESKKPNSRPRHIYGSGAKTTEPEKTNVKPKKPGTSLSVENNLLAKYGADDESVETDEISKPILTDKELAMFGYSNVKADEHDDEQSFDNDEDDHSAVQPVTPSTTPPVTLTNGWQQRELLPQSVVCDILRGRLVGASELVEMLIPSVGVVVNYPEIVAVSRIPQILSDPNKAAIARLIARKRFPEKAEITFGEFAEIISVAIEGDSFDANCGLVILRKYFDAIAENAKAVSAPLVIDALKREGFAPDTIALIKKDFDSRIEWVY